MKKKPKKLPYLPQYKPGYYCEDIIAQEDLEGLGDVIVLDLSNGILNAPEDFNDVMENYYFWWDGKNWNSSEIGYMDEVYAEEIDSRKDNNLIYTYYKAFNNLRFRVIDTPYIESLPEIDTEWGDWEKIEEKLGNINRYIRKLSLKTELINNDKGFFYLTETYQDYKKGILSFDDLEMIIQKSDIKDNIKKSLIDTLNPNSVDNSPSNSPTI